MRIMIQMPRGHWSHQRHLAAHWGLKTSKDVNGKNVHDFAILETNDSDKILYQMTFLNYPISVEQPFGAFHEHNKVDWVIREANLSEYY